MPAAKQLQGPAPLELQGLVSAGAGGSRQVLLGGLGTAPRPGQRVPQSGLQPPRLVTLRPEQLQGQAIKLRGPVKGQGIGGLLGGPGGMAASTNRFAGSLPMSGQYLRVARSRRLQHLGQAAVAVGSLFDAKVCCDGFAHPVVIGFYRDPLGRAGAAQQACRTQAGQGSRPLALHPGRPAGVFHQQRLASHGHHLQ